MANNTPLFLFGKLNPSLLRIGKVYKPIIIKHINEIPNSNPVDVDVPSDINEKIESDGFVVPSLQSLVIGELPKNILYVVVYTNPNTYESYLKEIVLYEDVDIDDMFTINYGNEALYLFFDDRVKPISLIVSSKLLIFGESNIEYQLIRFNSATKEEEIISAYYDSDGKFVSDRIPLRSVDHLSGTSAKICATCHTLLGVGELLPGDRVTLRVFNDLGQQTDTTVLLTRRSHILNDMDPETDPIVKFDATCNNMKGDNFLLYEKQDWGHLNITPVLTYSSGKQVKLVIDNKSTFIHGLDDFLPTFSGLSRPIVIKHYLAKREQSPLAESDRKNRYVSVIKTAIVVPSITTFGMKISVVPMWDTVDKVYIIKFIAYTENRADVIDVTNFVTMENNFRPTLYNKVQEIVFLVKLKDVFGIDSTDIYKQRAFITLFLNTEYQQYILQDDLHNSKVYGAEAPNNRRPIIHYDSNIKMYFIPTSIFRNKEAFLESFYYNANPPFDIRKMLQPTTPTHFTVRDIGTINTIISSPIEISQFSQAWNIVPATPESRYLDRTVIVEFLDKIGDEYFLLFGVPVKCLNSGTGYVPITAP